jgi:hypothetical protein
LLIPRFHRRKNQASGGLGLVVGVDQQVIKVRIQPILTVMSPDIFEPPLVHRTKQLVYIGARYEARLYSARPVANSSKQSSIDMLPTKTAC